MILFILISLFQIDGNDRIEYWLRQDYGDYIENNLFFNMEYNPFSIRIHSLSLLLPETDKYRQFLFKQLAGEFNGFKLNVGDFYSTYLNGLLLRANQDIAFRRYRWLSGLKASVEKKNLRISGFAGKPKNVVFNNYDYSIVNDTTQILMGLDLNLRYKSNKFELGYLKMRDKGDLSVETFTELYGVGTELDLIFSDLFFYYIHKGGCRPVIGGKYNGNGLIGGISFSHSSAGLQLYYTYYDSISLGNSIYKYNDPPPINRSEISINRGESERGVGSFFNASMGNYYLDAYLSNIRTLNGNKQVEDHSVHLEYPFDNSNLTLDYEYMYKKNFEPDVSKKIEHIPEIILENTVGEIGIQITGKIDFVQADSFLYQDYDSEISLSWNNISVTGGHSKRSKTIAYFENRKKWRKIEIKVDLPNNLIMKLMAGEEKGGLICSGGVCRWETPFSGFKFYIEKRL